jgi:hypothetical protein
MHIDVLRMQSEGNSPKNGEAIVGFSFTICSITPVGFGQGFLSQEQCNTTGAFPYSPDLAQADFFLFFRINLALQGRFCDANDIIKNTT